MLQQSRIRRVFCLMVIPFLLALWPATARGAEAPRVSAEAAMLMETNTGTVLYQKDADEKRHPASTTKIMTAILALELGDLEEEVTVSRRAAGTPGSGLGLGVGERYPLAELLEGLLLRSGNDAAVAIAEYLAGSVEEFAGLMNVKARQLGLVSTTFANPHGLTALGHYSSARDLAVLTRYALQNPRFARLVASPSGKTCGVDSRGGSIERPLRNTNRLLFSYRWSDRWANGVKTGTTSAAGNCLVASASNGGMELVSVVLGSRDRWYDSRLLLDWGFEQFTLLNLAPRGQTWRQIPVSGALPRLLPLTPKNDLLVTVAKDDASDIRVVSNVDPHLQAPIEKGSRVGSLTATLDGRVLARVDLLTGRDLARWSLWEWLFGDWRRPAPPSGLGLP